MVFILSSIIIAALTLWWIVQTTRSDVYMSLLGLIVGTIGQLLIGAVAWLAISMAATYGIASTVTDWSYRDSSYQDLVALKTADTIEGQFTGSIFASYGYIDGKRVLSYVTRDDDGGLRIGYSNASQTTIYENDEIDPTFETLHFVKENWWFFPANSFASLDNYKLTIPEGSVVQGYEITP